MFKIYIFIALLYKVAITTGLNYKDKPKGNYQYNEVDAEEKLAIEWLKEVNVSLQKMNNELSNAEWSYASNITDYNQEVKINVSLAQIMLNKKIWEKSITFTNWKKFKDPLVRRPFRYLTILDEYVLPEKELKKYKELTSEMEEIFAVSKVCQHNETKPNCSLNLEPELTRILATSRDYDEVLYVWKEWHDTVGKAIKKQYIKYVQYGKKIAKLNNFGDRGQMWRYEFEDDNFENEIESLFLQILPLYEQMHAYMRKQLQKIYGADKVRSKGPIPAHLLGNMWAQSWNNLYNDTMPYPKKQHLDITSVLKEKGFTPLQMFKTAEGFFTSVGLLPHTDTFWNKTIMEKPMDREIVCHASAWDFYTVKDFRIKMCTDITFEDFVTIHHEMGHIQYYMQYKNQPTYFRDGANSGFHEAIGDTIALSAGTTTHLKQIGLLEDYEEDDEADINFLYNMALEKVAFLPFGYLIDQWRWDLFRGDIKFKDLNKSWWNLRYKFQGIAPSVKRPECFFDPGSKYHIAADVPYVRYFLSFILQFQFHQALCKEAKHSGPLHRCDIYKSMKAGKKFSEVLKLGSSKSWPDTLEIFTGQRGMNASALLEYFDPLYKWLQKENKNEVLGWGYDWTKLKAKHGLV